MDPTVQTIVVFVIAFAAISLVLTTVLLIVRDMFFSSSGSVAQRLGASRPTAIPQLANPPVSDSETISQKLENWFGRLIYESGLNLTGETALLLETAIGLIVGGGLFLWLNDLMLGIIGFIVGMGAVIGFFCFWRMRRRRRMREQLPDVLDHLARAVRAGRTVDEAVQQVGNATNAPLGIEFKRCGRQLGMGLSVESAVRAMARRIPIPEMRILASTLIVQRRAGGNLPVTLERLSKVLRDRMAYYRQYQAATAGARFSAILIAIVGPAVAVTLSLIEPEYMQRFMTSWLGWALMAFAIAFYVVGLIWVFLVLQVDY